MPYLASALVTGTLGFGLLLAGWLATGLLAFTPLSIPVLVAFRWGVGALAAIEARFARLVGVDVGPQAQDLRRLRLLGPREGDPRRPQLLAAARHDRRPDVRRLAARGRRRLARRVGRLLSCSCRSTTAGSTSTSAPSTSTRSGRRCSGSRSGSPGAIVALALVHWTARGWARVVLPYLAPPRGPAKSFFVPHAAVVALTDVVVLIVWASVGGPFWPKWVLAATTLTISLHAWLLRAPSALARVVGVAVFLEAFQIALWVFGGGGYFWPVWTAIGFAAAVAVAAVVLRRGRLEHRIEVLETTRAGAVDVQETELRRIERDLHDGAQARLVALGMNLGLAEQKLAGDPEAARDLVAEARAGVEQALRELRDLARGVHPPVLTDRGLGAAVASLAHASAIPVDVEEDVPERPPAVGRDGGVLRRRRGDGERGEARRGDADHGADRAGRAARLVVEIADDGRGGADVAGSGLVGLRRRVEALDGTLAVTSPSGGGTVLRAELPCES